MEGFFSIYILPNCRVILKLANGDKIVYAAVRSAVFSIVYSQYLFVTVKILPTAVCRPLLSSAAEVEPGQTRSGYVNLGNGGDLSLRQRDDDSTATKEVDWLRFGDCQSRVGALFLTEKHTNRPTRMDSVINSHATLLYRRGLFKHSISRGD
jgi:hypothetical protein